MISTSNNFIFIHISKCAGTSISSALSSYTSATDRELISDEHSTYIEYEQILGESIKKYNIFTSVRNPFDRCLSQYTYWNEGKYRHNHAIQKDGMDIIEATWKINDFNKWVKFIGLTEGGIHFDNQVSWLKDSSGKIDESIVICKFENIANEIMDISKKFNINIDKFEKLNTSNHGQYRNVYNQESIDIVTERYKKDLDFFKYKY